MLRRLFRKHPKLFALGFGLIFMVLMLVLIEVIFAVLIAMRPGPGPEDWDPGAPGQFEGPPNVYDERLSYRPPANGNVRNWKENEHGTIYDYRFTTDEFHRRITPVENPEQRDKFLIFFGGSYTFGEGVEDDETLPAQAGELAPEYMPYNYGFQGWGPAQMFLLLKDDNFEQQIQQKSGIALYTFIIHHKERLFGSMQVTNGWGAAVPMLRWRRGKMVYAGPFYDEFPKTHAFYKWLGKSNTLSYFGVNFPIMSDRHDKFFAEVIAESKKEFLDKYPDSKFYFVFYPYTYGQEGLMRHLDELGVEYFDYTALLKESDENVFEGQEKYFFRDFHPRPLAHQKLAEKLVGDLGIGSSGPDSSATSAEN